MENREESASGVKACIGAESRGKRIRLGAGHSGLRWGGLAKEHEDRHVVDILHRDAVPEVRRASAERKACVGAFAKGCIQETGRSARADRHAQICGGLSYGKTRMPESVVKPPHKVEVEEIVLVDDSHLGHAKPKAGGEREDPKDAHDGREAGDHVEKGRGGSSANAVNGPWGSGWAATRVLATRSSNKIAQRDPEAGHP